MGRQWREQVGRRGTTRSSTLAHTKLELLNRDVERAGGMLGDRATRKPQWGGAGHSPEATRSPGALDGKSEPRGHQHVEVGEVWVSVGP